MNKQVKEREKERETERSQEGEFGLMEEQHDNIEENKLSYWQFFLYCSIYLFIF